MTNVAELRPPTLAINAERYEIHHPYLRKPLAFIGIEGEHQSKIIQSTGKFYEQDLLDALEPYTWRRAGIVIDVGACLGNHTLYFAGVLGFHVLSIEPCDISREILRQMVMENNLEDYIMFSHIAAGAANGKAFLDPPKISKIGSLRLRAIQIPGASEIPVATLDHLYRTSRWKERPVVLIKIDVEGMEAEVLKGSVNILKEHTPIFAIECADEAHLHEVEAILAPFGYKRKGPYCATPTYIFHIEEPRIR